MTWTPSGGSSPTWTLSPPQASATWPSRTPVPPLRRWPSRSRRPRPAQRAAQLMTEHGASHLVVVDRDHRPVGIHLDAGHREGTLPDGTVTLRSLSGRPKQSPNSSGTTCPCRASAREVAAGRASAGTFSARATSDLLPTAAPASRSRSRSSSRCRLQARAASAGSRTTSMEQRARCATRSATSPSGARFSTPRAPTTRRSTRGAISVSASTGESGDDPSASPGKPSLLTGSPPLATRIRSGASSRCASPPRRRRRRRVPPPILPDCDRPRKQRLLVTSRAISSEHGACSSRWVPTPPMTVRPSRPPGGSPTTSNEAPRRAAAPASTVPGAPKRSCDRHAPARPRAASSARCAS